MSRNGHLPDGWNLTQLGDIGRYINGYAFKPSDWQDVGLPIIRIQNLTDSSKPFNRYPGALEDRYFIRKGDIVISWSATLGVYRWNGPDAWLNQHIFKAIAKDEVINNGFFYYAVTRAVDQMSQAAHGSTMQHVTSSAFAESPVLLPPLPEQRKIAEILGSVDENIEKTEALIAKLQDLKKATMQELLTKGIGHTKFKDSPVGRIPEEWEIVELRAVCKKVTDGAHTSVRTAETGVPFLYISCVRDGQILWDEAAYVSEEDYITISKGREPIPGLILYTAVGSYGNAALVTDDRRFTFQRHIAYILPDEKKISPRYLVCWMNSPMCKRHADIVALGNAQKTVTLGSLAEFPVPLPTLSEQEHIVDCLDAVDANIQSKKRRLEKLNHTKKALMQDLLAGKVRVKI